MSFTATPWMRTGLRAAGIDRAAFTARIPSGWSVTGSARRPDGPYVLQASTDEPPPIYVSAPSWDELPAAVERLLVLMTGDDLEAQLAASLRAMR